MVRLRAALAGLFLVGMLGPAGALDAPERPPEPPRDLPRTAAPADLDRLFALLKRAPDRETAKLVEARIWGQWLKSGSDTTDLLMARVRNATEAGDSATAIALLDAVVAIAPDYVEAWNRRATLHYLRKDFGAALGDLAETLAREPRHFGALVGLGLILQDIGQDKPALEAFRKALALNPHIERVPDLIRQLEPKVDGRDI